MRLAAALFAIAAAAIVATWAWLGAAVEMPASPFGPGGKLNCVSYAPFRGAQDPFGPDVPIDPRQIEEDLAQLKPLTDCVRTYSTDHGLDQIAGIAKRHGMKVMQGLWLSNSPDLSRKQIESAVALANSYPDVIEAVIVGNEVLLRGEMSAPELVGIIREVKRRVPMPVTYADVWEFWLRNRDVAGVVDFITIHILPYWEDFPIPARNAPVHVSEIRRHIVDAFPGKEVFVGEFGWPSAGRMREGALPSPVTAARVMHEVLARARQENFRVNLIEAYDQPWKRQLEGTVGGHWGLFDAYDRQAKFVWGNPVSDHAQWRWQALGGVVFAALVFGTALAAGWQHPAPPARVWFAVGANAAVAGALIGWTVKNIPLESLTVGVWVRSLSWLAVGALAPLVGAAAVAADVTLPSFAAVLGRRADRTREPLAFALALLLMVLTLLAVQAALGLVFDPRYRDFPFAPLIGATIPFLVMARWPRRRDIRMSAETAAAVTLALSGVYILFNETLSNWQSLWFCAALAALAFTLLPARVAPS